MGKNVGFVIEGPFVAGTGRDITAMIMTVRQWGFEPVATKPEWFESTLKKHCSGSSGDLLVFYTGHGDHAPFARDTARALKACGFAGRSITWIMDACGRLGDIAELQEQIQKEYIDSARAPIVRVYTAAGADNSLPAAARSQGALLTSDVSKTWSRTKPGRRSAPAPMRMR